MLIDLTLWKENKAVKLTAVDEWFDFQLLPATVIRH